MVSYIRGSRTPTVRAVIDNLRKAKVDPRVRAVLLKPTGFESPFWGKVQELRDAVLDFRKSGKPVYAYLEYGGDREYFLASAADKVFLMPSTACSISGVATYELFLFGHLDEGRRVRRHAPYRRVQDRGEYFHRKGLHGGPQVDQSLNRDLYEQIVRGIADSRKKNEADVRALIDDGPFLPEDALRAGLIDDVAYRRSGGREAPLRRESASISRATTTRASGWRRSVSIADPAWRSSTPTAPSMAARAATTPATAPSSAPTR